MAKSCISAARAAALEAIAVMFENRLACSIEKNTYVWFNAEMEITERRAATTDSSGEGGGLQAAKSDRMRRSILATTAARLAALGYHATSIKKIAAAGGFSIGALQHHFPSKQDLMVAVVERALERAENYALVKFRRSKHAAISELVTNSWRDQIQTDWYLAMLEIFVAARTDAGLRARIAPAIRGFAEETEKQIAGLFHGAHDRREAEFLLTVSRCMMGGLVVQDALALPKSQVQRLVRQWTDFIDRSQEKPGD